MNTTGSWLMSSLLITICRNDTRLQYPKYDSRVGQHAEPLSPNTFLPHEFQHHFCMVDENN